SAFRNVVGIASPSPTDARSSFTNCGDHLVRFAAPGEGLITLYPGQRYASVSGTSFSTALASGASLLIAQLEPTVDQRLTGRYFDDGALKLPGAELGEGRIDLLATLQGHLPGPPPPPPPPPADTVAPTVTMSYPATGATVTGTIPLAATASDDVGVVSVQFAVDGVNLGGAHTAPPYAVTLDSATVPNGVHVVSATARDAAGNLQTATASVTVANDTTAPTVSLTTP